MRLPTLPPQTLSPEQRPLYEDMKSVIGTTFKGFKAIDENGALIGPWNPWLTFPQFGGPMWEFTKAMAVGAKLPKPVREVAIIVTGTHFHARYELYAHIRVGELVGLSNAKIATMVAGQKPADLTAAEAMSYDFTAALVSGGVIPNILCEQATEAFGKDGVAELIYLVGLYSAVSILLNGFDVPVPE